MNSDERRYNDLNSYLRSLFGCRVQKITIDAGLSCPNRDGTIATGGCIYCNAYGSGTGAFREGRSVTEQVREGIKFMAWRYKAKKYIAYFQSFSNTYAPLDQLKGMYEEALAFEEIVGLFVGTRPDCVDKPVMDLLRHYNEKYLVWIDFGLQSVHDATLALINRGHDFSSFEKAVHMAKQRNIKVCAHVILGLPGEERQHMLETAKTLAEMGIEGVKLHMLYVVRGTELERQYRKGDYRCLEQEEYVDLVCDFLELLPKETIIQRLTGEPRSGELVAPLWAQKKRDTLNLIEQALVERDSWQGKKFAPEL